MRIDTSQVQMHMEHQLEQQSSSTHLLVPSAQANGFAQLFSRLSTPGTAPPASNDGGAAAAATGAIADLLSANLAATQLSPTPTTTAMAPPQSERQAQLLSLIKELLATLEGLLLRLQQGKGSEEQQELEQLSTQILDTQAPPKHSAANDKAWTRISLTHTEEQETLCFAAQGCVRTTAGEEIRFQLEFAMARHTSSTQLDWTQDSLTRLVDPLVLNFAGQAATLSGSRIQFDLSGSNQEESLPLLQGGSGYVAFDRNGDGHINDGSELFGAISGNGFADLGQLDEDGNGWLDAGDTPYSQLLLWRPTPDGKGELTPLSELGVGALYLQSIGTPFKLTDEAGNTQAVLRHSGLWLGEQGQIGSLQHLDVAV